MASAEQEIVINAPAEQVFNYVADVSRHGEWGDPQHKLEIEKTSDGPVGPGTTFSSVGHQFGKNEDSGTITEYVPNQRLVMECEGNAGLMKHSFDIEPAGGGVRLKKRFEPLQSKFPFALFAPIAIRFAVPKGLQGDLERIKANIEGAAS